MAKLNKEEFVIRAITALRTGKQKGLSTATAGLQDAFKHHYGVKADLVKTCARMQAAGKLVMRPTGREPEFSDRHMIYLPDEAPAQKRTAQDVLAIMGIKPKRALVKAS